MADFDLSKITGREPPLVTDDERDAEIAYLSDVVANRDRELAALRARVAEYERVETQWMEWNSGLRARVAELETALARQRQYEYVQAQHEETGRDWFGARYNIPERFHEVSNESGVPGPTARLPGSDTGSRE